MKSFCMREKKMSVSTNRMPLPNAYITEGNIEIGDNNKTTTKKNIRNTQVHSDTVTSE